MLEQELLKSEQLDIPLKKSKLDEYAAYLYAAAMDPLYIHAAMYEQWSNRQLQVFRPVPNNLFPKEGKSKHTHPSIGRYKDPPVLQNPERVVPMSESERFERSFQPNVALAPPKVHKYKTEDVIKTEEVIEDSPRIDNTTTVITKDFSQRNQKNEQIERTNSAVVDSTVSVVQSTGQQRYNSEIELSTDTDDSLSDASGDNNRKISDINRIVEALSAAPEEIKERVMDLVKNIIKEHDQAILRCQEKDERIRQLEQRIRELETSSRQPEDFQDSGSRQSEYDVSSSRAEIPESEDTRQEERLDEVSVEMVSSGTEEMQNGECGESGRVTENNNSVILAINPSTNEKIVEAIKSDAHE